MKEAIPFVLKVLQPVVEEVFNNVKLLHCKWKKEKPCIQTYT